MKQDGGPAFPDKVVQDTVLGPSVFARMDGGMTLRDWFAGQALPAFIQWGSLDKSVRDGEKLSLAVEGAYAAADFMLKQREKP